MNSLNLRSFSIPANMQHPNPKDGFRLARIVKAHTYPFFSSHDTVSEKGHKDLKDWITNMGYTEYEVEIAGFFLDDGYGFAVVNMK